MPEYVGGDLEALVVACEEAETNHAKGEALADLVEHVFGAVPGLTCTYRGLTEPEGTDEIDLIFQHHFMESGISIPQVTLMMECKNQARKLSAEQVTRFATKMRDHNQQVGFMISKSGLSGRGSTHGHGAIRTELSHGRTIVVLTIEDLRDLSSTDELVAVCEERRHELEVWRSYKTI